MSKQSLAKQSDAAKIRKLNRGELIYVSAYQGPAWRIIENTVRLDLHAKESGENLASLALPGDMSGIEPLFFGRDGFTARALTPRTPIPHDAADHPLAQMATAVQRAAQVVALRAGSAAGHIQYLVALVTNHGGLPHRMRQQSATASRCLQPPAA